MDSGIGGVKEGTGRWGGDLTYCFLYLCIICIDDTENYLIFFTSKTANKYIYTHIHAYLQLIHILIHIHT